MAEFRYFYAWKNNQKRKTLYKKACKVLARGAKNSCCVEFENGQREIISRNALRRIKNEVGNPCKYPRPYIIRNDARIFFDAVYPVVYANGTSQGRGEGYHCDTGNTTVIPSSEFFLLRQLWPKKCYPSEAAAMQALHPPQQASLF